MKRKLLSESKFITVFEKIEYYEACLSDESSMFKPHIIS